MSRYFRLTKALFFIGLPQKDFEDYERIINIVFNFEKISKRRNRIKSIENENSTHGKRFSSTGSHDSGIFEEKGQHQSQPKKFPDAPPSYGSLAKNGFAVSADQINSTKMRLTSTKKEPWLFENIQTRKMAEEALSNSKEGEFVIRSLETVSGNKSYCLSVNSRFGCRNFKITKKVNQYFIGHKFFADMDELIRNWLYGL